MAELISDTFNLEDYFEESHDGENVRPASHWRDGVKDIFHGNGKMAGAKLPWHKTHDDIRFRDGEVSLWHGANGMGKSMITSHVALDLCAQGERVCIASMEMQPAKTMARMCRQASGANQPSLESIDNFHHWTDSKLWLYDRRGSVKWTNMVPLIRCANDKFQIKHFFIDSLMKCVMGEADYDGQKDFVNALCTVSMDLNMHIHLLHHTKKPSDVHAVPGKYDAKGSGSISDQVDNVFGVWRNKQKEEDRRYSKADESHPDAVVNCDKQRNGEWEGRVGLWYDPASFQYRGEQEYRPRSYLSKKGVSHVQD